MQRRGEANSQGLVHAHPLRQQAEREVLPACKQATIAAAAFSVFGLVVAVGLDDRKDLEFRGRSPAGGVLPVKAAYSFRSTPLASNFHNAYTLREGSMLPHTTM